ncbi:MAG: hypothetical protein U1F33_05515 [Alphaproteobacteria bacterium]
MEDIVKSSLETSGKQAERPHYGEAAGRTLWLEPAHPIASLISMTGPYPLVCGLRANGLRLCLYFAVQVAAVLLAAVAGLAPARPAMAQTFAEFYSMEGGFAASFPRKPDYSTEQTAGGTPLHQYLVNLGRIAYLVAYSDEPADETEDPEVSLKRMQDSATRDMILQQQAKTSYGPYPGRAFIYRDGSGVIVRQHIYLVRKRYYQVIFAGSDQPVDAELSERFFASFRLL